MTDRRMVISVAAAIWCVVNAGCESVLARESSAGFDTADDELSIGVKIVPTATLMPPATEEAMSTRQPERGNPLWGISLVSLHATRERPLFSPSRRPPAPVVTSAPVKSVPRVAPVAAAEPTLSLLGIVAGDGEGFAVFINTTTHDIIRLKTGEGEDGWILRSVSGREAVLENNHRTQVLEMPPITGVSK